MNIKSSWKKLFARYFAKYFLVSIILILISFIIEYNVIPELTGKSKTIYAAELIGYICTTAGVALLVASIFTFTIESSSFLDYIRMVLRKVVVSKEFLKNLTAENKAEALKLVLKPSTALEAVYANVDEYVSAHVEESLHLFETNFKSNVNFTGFVKREDNGVFYLKESYTMRIHRALDAFEPLSFGFEDPRSKIISAAIVSPDGDQRVNVSPENFNQKKKVEESGFEWYEYTYVIPDYLQKCTYLNLEYEFTEYGQSHWQTFHYKLLQPSDGIDIVIYCCEGVVVKDYMIYDKDRNYSVKKDNPGSIKVSCHQWMKPGSGISILVGDANTDKNLEQKAGENASRPTRPQFNG